MARDSVVKTSILSHSARKDDVLTLLENRGRIHLIDISGEEDNFLSPFTQEENTRLNKLGSALGRAIPLLRDLAGKGRGGDSQAYTVQKLQKLLENEGISRAAFRAAEISDQLSDLESSAQEQQRQIDFLSKWKDLPVPFEQINREGLFSVRAGTVASPDGFEALGEIEEEESLFHFTKLSDTRAVVLWHTSTEERILNSLAEAGFASEDFSGFSKSPERELEDLEARLSETRRKTKDLEREADGMVKLLPGFQALKDAAGLENFRQNAAAAGRESSTSVLLHAWARESDVPLLRKALEELGEVELEMIEPREDEVPPVYLSESAAADPYLMLTDMYGRPRGADPDPTPIMAPFYVMFFGICIGDAGYGIALAAGAAAGWYLTEKRKGNSRLFRLLFQGGLASIFWGILLGGWFGMAFHKLPAILQAAAEPLNSLLPSGGYTPETGGFSLSNQFLYLTLVLGVVQLGWGLVVNLKKRLREGEGLPAIIDQTGWILALLGLFPWLFDHYLFNIYSNEGIIDSVLMVMLAAGALLIFIMGGREAGGIGGKVGLGAYACYGIVNLLGDVLSYSRLFALALSSAIIASVINDIAGMLSASIPVLGFILALLVLVAGHVFNIAMAVLSGFIHTARLQFVEFFGKFYDGTGVPFRALRYEPQFVRIER